MTLWQKPQLVISLTEKDTQLVTLTQRFCIKRNGETETEKLTSAQHERLSEAKGKQKRIQKTSRRKSWGQRGFRPAKQQERQDVKHSFWNAAVTEQIYSDIEGQAQRQNTSVFCMDQKARAGISLGRSGLRVWALLWYLIALTHSLRVNTLPGF